MKNFEEIINYCLKKQVTDIHLTGNHPLVLRKDGEIYFDRSTLLTPQEIDSMVLRLLSPRHKAMLAKRYSVDMARTVAGTRLRINCFFTTRGLSIAVRFLPGKIPTVDQLNLHPSLHELTDMDAGLILICGATGSGKSTSIASMLNEINCKRPRHVITLEDPIEYRFSTQKSFFEQRELEEHFYTFEQGLLDALREMPDVVLVGELREAEAIRLTINAAESGHLVFATLHAKTAEESLYRMCNAFPLETQEFVRYQLSSCLQAVIVQQLKYFPEHGYRLPLLSILRATPGICGAIRDNKLSQIDSIMEMSRHHGMYTFDRYYKEFIQSGYKFIPPQKSLQPSKELYAQENVPSQLKEGTVTTEPKPATPSYAGEWSDIKSGGEEKVRTYELKEEEAVGQPYNIQGDEDLDSIIAEMKKE